MDHHKRRTPRAPNDPKAGNHSLIANLRWNAHHSWLPAKTGCTSKALRGLWKEEVSDGLFQNILFIFWLKVLQRACFSSCAFNLLGAWEDRAAGLPTYQFLRSSTSARAARARLRTELDRPTDRCPPPTQLSHEMQSPEPTELEIA